MSDINYDHSKNSHSFESPEVLIPLLLNGSNITSLLDVGAGTGVWISAARRFGINDTVGIDGITVNGNDFQWESNMITKLNLVNGFQLDRRFDIALCLEVAEHLPSYAASLLVKSITFHTDLCIFSAAIPGQLGQGHINCQWPPYWQALFNEYGFECSDDIRPRIWDLNVEPWYRQNMFRAFKSENAGSEPRILSIIHPQMLDIVKTA